MTARANRAATAALAALIACALVFPAAALAIDTYEPDNNRERFTRLTPDSAAVEREITASDIDWFSIPVIAGTTYVIEGVPTAEEPWTDINLKVYAPDGQTVLASDDDAGTNYLPHVIITASASGDLFVGVAGFSQWSSGGYMLRARTIDPAFIGGRMTGVAGIPAPGVTANVFALDGQTWGRIASTKTDSSGTYRFMLEAGTYRFGYEVPGNPVTTLFAGGNTLETARDMTLAVGQDLSMADTVVVSWGRLSGSVARTDGTPLAGAGVEIYRNDPAGWSAFAWTTAAADGSWGTSLCEGTYRVRFTDPRGELAPAFFGGALAATTASDVILTAQGALIDATLTNATSISGTARDARTGTPLLGINADVMTRNSAGEYAKAIGVRTGDDGRYSMIVPAGTYALRLSSADGTYEQRYVGDAGCALTPQILTVDAAGHQSVTDLQPASKIVGAVSEAGSTRALVGIQLRVFHADADGTWHDTGIATITRLAGVYEITGLPAGRYALVPALDGSPLPDPSTGTIVTAAAGATVRDANVAAKTDFVAPTTTDNVGNRLLYAPATIELVASDAGSGVATTSYRVDRGPWANGSAVRLSAAGAHTVEYFSTDRAGNVEQVHSAIIQVRESTVTVKEIAGTQRFDTAARLSKDAFPAGADTVIAVTGASWADGLGAASLAGATDAPILLVQQNKVPAATAAEIQRLRPRRAIIVGGPSVVGNEVAAFLASVVGAGNVERIGGDDRYETAALVAERTIVELASDGIEWDGGYILASGLTFPDVLAASPVSAAKFWPVLLTKPNTLPTATAEFLGRHAGARGLVVGGNAVVGATVATNAGNLTGARVERVAGSDRYQTALAVAKYASVHGILDYSRVALATGQDFPDALACSVRQAKLGGVLLLSPTNKLNQQVADLLGNLDSAERHEITFVGGVAAISTDVRQAALSLLAD